MQRSSMRRVAAALGIATPIVAAAIYLHPGTAQAAYAVRSLRGLQPVGLIVAVTLNGLSMLISGFLWSRLLQCLGHRLPLRVGIAAYLAAGLASYAANVVGSAAGSALLLGRYGLSRQRATLLALLANLLGFCGMVLWAPMSLFVLGHMGASAGAVPLGRPSIGAAGALLTFFAVVLIAFKAFAALLAADNALVRRLRNKVRLTGSPIRGRSLLLLIPVSAASWLVGALALYALLEALSPGASLNPGTVIGALALANVLGSLAFFVPAGVGVREGALVTLLMHSTGLPVAECVAATLSMRALDLGTKLALMLVIGASIAVRRTARRGTLARPLRLAPGGRIAPGHGAMLGRGARPDPQLHLGMACAEPDRLAVAGRGAAFGQPVPSHGRRAA